MNIFSILALICSLAFALHGVAAIRLGWKRAEHRLLFILAILCAWMNFTVAFSYSAPTREAVEFWYRMFAPSAGFIWAVNLHFHLVLFRREIPWHKALILYLPAPFIIYAGVFDVMLFSDFIQKIGYWIFIPAATSIWFYVYVVYGLSSQLACLIILFYRYRHACTCKERMQTVIFLVSLTVFLVLSSAVDLVVSSSEGIDLPAFGPIVFIIYFGALYYAIFKYRFLDFSPSLVADEIISNIRDMVVLIDTDRNVIVMNKECESALYMNANECLGRSFADLVHEADLVSRDLNALLGGEVPSVTRRLHFKQSSGIIIADSYLALVRDCFGDPVGVLMVGKENKGVSELRRRCGITERQLVIMELAARGATNTEIAERLGIAKGQSNHTSITCTTSSASETRSSCSGLRCSTG